MTDNFINERDRRKEFLTDRELIPEIREAVKRNGTPISSRTVKETFNAQTFGELKGTRLRVWIATGKLLDALEAEGHKYEKYDL